MKRAVVLCILTGGLASMNLAEVKRPHLLPKPKRVIWRKGRVRLSSPKKGKAFACFIDATRGSRAVAAGIRVLNERLEAEGCEPLPVVSRAADAHPSYQLIWVGTVEQVADLEATRNKPQPLPDEMQVPDGYLLAHMRLRGPSGMACIGADERGCYYGLCTLAQTLLADDVGVHAPRCRVVDWPTYRLRLAKVSAVNGDPDAAIDFSGILPQYKLNLYGLQYHQERGATWRDPSERYVRVMTEVGETARRDGVLEPAVFLSPFFGPRIDTTKPEEVEVYLDRLRWALNLGFRWVQIDFNDWSKWQYLSDAERDRFADVADFTAHLTNEVHETLRAERPDVGVILCPMVGWYHGPADEEVAKLCRNVPEDVLVYWTGPVVRSHTITERELAAWTETTGRRPFLWDNTIYDHYRQYWVGCIFNPYMCSFPENMPELLAGPGIHLNANANRHYLPSLMTFADYMWNPEGYDPGASIDNALRILWGNGAPEAAAAVRESLLAVYKLLYEAGQGWVEFDQGEAEALLAALEAAVERLGVVAEDTALLADMRSEYLDEARKAVESFEPPQERRPRPELVERPISEGAVNPSAEEVLDGRPVGWSLYQGAGEGKVAASEEARTGTWSAHLRATRWFDDPSHAVHRGRRWINIALVQGSDLGGFQGLDAYDVEPNTEYRVTFHVKGDAPKAVVVCQGWGLTATAGARHELPCDLAELKPTAKWKRYACCFRTRFDTRKFALKLGPMGYEDEGMSLGEVWVDDISIGAVE